MRSIIDIIAPCLEYILSLVLESGSFPTKMKMAKVSLTCNGGDKNNVNNYRHVSVLPVFSKGLEKNNAYAY